LNQQDPGVGARLRQARRQRGITLKQVAAAAGVTESFVSQVERGVANPSVATLRRIAEAIGEQVGALFMAGDGEHAADREPTGPGSGTVVRAGQRRRLHHPSQAVEEYLLTPASAKSLEIMYVAIDEGQGSGAEPYTHEADEECVIVIAGQLDVGSNGEMHHLSAGDALLLDPKLPHSYRNPGPGRATTLWVTSPGGY
jgi:transcriptional regulator with XRE-family HTH domain